MANKEKITNEKFKEALRNSFGNKTAIAQRLGVSWVGLWKYLNRHQELNEQIELEEKQLVSLAHGKLVNKVNNEIDWAIKFVLSTKGGYTENPQILNMIKNQMNVGPQYTFEIIENDNKDAETPIGEEVINDH